MDGTFRCTGSQATSTITGVVYVVQRQAEPEALGRHEREHLVPGTGTGLPRRRRCHEARTFRCQPASPAAELDYSTPAYTPRVSAVLSRRAAAGTVPRPAGTGTLEPTGQLGQVLVQEDRRRPGALGAVGSTGVSAAARLHPGSLCGRSTEHTPPYR